MDHVRCCTLYGGHFGLNRFSHSEYICLRMLFDIFTATYRAKLISFLISTRYSIPSHICNIHDVMQPSAISCVAFKKQQIEIVQSKSRKDTLLCCAGRVVKIYAVRLRGHSLRQHSSGFYHQERLLPCL